jgi:hypothetical protein
MIIIEGPRGCIVGIGVRPGDRPRCANGLAPARASPVEVVWLGAPAARTRLGAETGLVVQEVRRIDEWAEGASVLCCRAGSGTMGSAPSISISNANSERVAELGRISASPLKNSWAGVCVIALADSSRGTGDITLVDASRS